MTLMNVYNALSLCPGSMDIPNECAAERYVAEFEYKRQDIANSGIDTL